MQIAAETKFKHGTLYKALNQLNMTQTQFADEAGISRNHFSKIFTLKVSPGPEAGEKIRNTLEDYGIIIDLAEEWPEAFRGMQFPFKVVQLREIPVDHLIEKYQWTLLMEPPLQEDMVDFNVIKSVVDKLPDEDRDLIKNLFLEKMPLKEYIKEYNLDITPATLHRQLEEALNRTFKKFGSNYDVSYRKSTKVHINSNLKERNFMFK